MRTSTQKTSIQWENIGRRCASQGWPVEVALTKNESINILIRKGHEAAMKRKIKEDKT